MAEHYNFPAQDFSASGEWNGGLTDEERRALTLRNLAMSKAAKGKRKKKKSPQKPAARQLTEPERRLREQARIQEEREIRRALSEANRRDAGIGEQKEKETSTDPKPVQQPKPDNPKKPKKTQNQKKKSAEPTPTDVSKINIDIPAEPAPKPVRKQKKSAGGQKKQKQTTDSRTVRAARFSHEESAPRRYHNRITTSGAVTLGILTGVLIGTVIYGRVQTNEVYSVITEKQAEYDDLVAKNISMKSEMEGKMTVKNIEEYAENELGLMPLDQSQIVYLQLQTEDEVTISEPEDNLFVTVNDYLVSIWEYLRGK